MIFKVLIYLKCFVLNKKLKAGKVIIKYVIYK